MNSKESKTNIDLLGIWSSFLCLIHCLALPIAVNIFGFAQHSVVEIHWLDYFFIVLSLFAAVTSIKSTRSKKIKLLLAFGWVLFAIGLFFHDSLLEYTMHLGTIILIFAHWNNLKFLRAGTCFIDNGKK